MEVKITYPKIRKKRITYTMVQEALKTVFILISSLCLFLNIISGGHPWSLIVVYAHWTSYRGFTGNIFENTIWIRVSQGIQNLCMLLFIINSIYGFNFAPLTIGLVYLGLFVILVVNFMVDIKGYSMNLLPITEVLSKILMVFVGSLFGLLSMNWALVLLLILSILFMTYGLIRFKAEVFLEMKKRFH